MLFTPTILGFLRIRSSMAGFVRPAASLFLKKDAEARGDMQFWSPSLARACGRKWRRFRSGSIARKGLSTYSRWARGSRLPARPANLGFLDRGYLHDVVGIEVEREIKPAADGNQVIEPSPFRGPQTKISYAIER